MTRVLVDGGLMCSVTELLRCDAVYLKLTQQTKVNLKNKKSATIENKLWRKDKLFQDFLTQTTFRVDTVNTNRFCLNYFENPSQRNFICDNWKINPNEKVYA